MYVVNIFHEFFEKILHKNLETKKKIKYNKSECLTFFFKDYNEKRNIHMNKCMYMTFLQDQLIFSTANLTVIY